MNGQFSWTQSAGEELSTASKTGAQTFQSLADSHQTATKQMGGLLEGAGLDEATTVGTQMFKRASEGQDVATKQAGADGKCNDINQAGIARMQTFFGNRG